MTIPAPLSHLIDIDVTALSHEERILLELELFHSLLYELKLFLTNHYKEYFSLLKLTHNMEMTMIENYFIPYIINDILASGEYSISGIAYYTQIPEELIYDIAAGLQNCVSLSASQKIIELHRSVRGELYRYIFQKCKNKLIT